jgi:hypothetical protein
MRGDGSSRAFGRRETDIERISNAAFAAGIGQGGAGAGRISGGTRTGCRLDLDEPAVPLGDRGFVGTFPNREVLRAMNHEKRADDAAALLISKRRSADACRKFRLPFQILRVRKPDGATPLKP